MAGGEGHAPLEGGVGERGRETGGTGEAARGIDAYPHSIIDVHNGCLLTRNPSYAYPL